MEEAGLALKGLDGAAAGVAQILGDLLAGVIPHIQLIVHHVHAGIDVPITPGIMPVINGAQIQRMVTLCGASLPERFEKIIKRYGDNKQALFDAGMAYALSQIIDLLANDVDGLHLYTMNNPVVAKRICEGIRNLV